ncbi:MAG: hypothetical protein ABJL25_20120 [Rhizobiaceae bacterium]
MNSVFSLHALAARKFLQVLSLACRSAAANSAIVMLSIAATAFQGFGFLVMKPAMLA